MQSRAKRHRAQSRRAAGLTSTAIAWGSLLSLLVACGTSKARPEADTDDGAEQRDKPKTSAKADAATPTDDGGKASTPVEASVPSSTPPAADAPDASAIVDASIVDAAEELPIGLQPGQQLRPGDGVPDAGTEFGEVDEQFNFATVCLHIDVDTGTYELVPGILAPEDTQEPVVNFGKVEEGFRVMGFFPWELDYVDPKAPPNPIPEGLEVSVSATRAEASFIVRFVAEKGRIKILQVQAREAD